MGQSSKLAPATSPYTVRALNSWSLKRKAAPAQWIVVPPTAFTVQAGRLGKFLATRHEPEVVRLSSQAILLNIGHSSLTKSLISTRLPASRRTTLTPFWHSSLANVPPPAPEPIMTTTLSSFNSYFAMSYSTIPLLTTQ